MYMHLNINRKLRYMFTHPHIVHVINGNITIIAIVMSFL